MEKSLPAGLALYRLGIWAPEALSGVLDLEFG